MSFGGGGGGQLANHVHDNTPLQGGPLDMANVTIGSLSAGSVVYSDGNALQELVAPGVPAGETLTFAPAATAPSWGAAGGGNWEVLGSTTLGAPANDITISFGAVTVTDISRVVAVFNGEGATSNTTSMQVNGITSSDWSRDGFMAYGGTSVTLNDSAKGSLDLGSWQAGEKQFIVCSLSSNRVAEKIQAVFQTSAESGWLGGSGFLDVAGQTTITEVKFHTQGGVNLSTGSNLTVYRQNVV